MDYNSLKCPVCKKEFKDGDDIVVCPQCGTPHHRQCYEIENRCFYQDRHSEGFSYEEYAQEQNNAENADGTSQGNGQQRTSVCPRCKAENPENMFYCGKCGFPLGMQNNPYGQPNQGNPQNPTGQPFGAYPFDPMAGVNPNEDMGDGVTAGEASKYVQKNTPYFMTVFSRIKCFGKGRFNISAFLFSGGYLLYRKMYKLGGIISGIMLALITFEAYVRYSPAYDAFAKALEQAMSNATGVTAVNYFYEAFYSLDISGQVLIGLMSVCSMIELAIEIVVGLKANKWYFKHCKKQIVKIKAQPEKAQAELETKGGVNIALAVSMYVVYLIVSYLPGIIMGL